MANDEPDGDNVSLPTRKCDKANFPESPAATRTAAQTWCLGNFWPPPDLQLVHSVNPGEKPNEHPEWRSTP